jgi:hypothetical protein
MTGGYCIFAADLVNRVGALVLVGYKVPQLGSARSKYCIAMKVKIKIKIKKKFS